MIRQLEWLTGKAAYELCLRVVTLVSAASVLGCKNEGRSGEPGGPGPAEVRLGYFANLTHAQAVLGVSTGEFGTAVAPAAFRPTVFNAGPSLIEALFANEIDVGYIGPGPALNGYAKSRGAKVRVVAGSAANGVLVVARPDSGVTKLSDLAGKKVATPQFGNTQDIAARQYLRFELKQASLAGVTPVPNAEQAGLMARGQIDAAWAPEPWASLLISQAGARLVAEERALWPEGAFATTVVITTPDFLRKHPDVVDKVLGVHAGWTEKLAAAPDRHLPALEAALLKLTNKSLPAGVLAAALKNTRFTDDPLPHTFRKFAEWSYDLELAKDRTDVSGMFDPAPLRRAKAARAAATTTASGTVPVAP